MDKIGVLLLFFIGDVGALRALRVLGVLRDSNF